MNKNPFADPEHEVDYGLKGKDIKPEKIELSEEERREAYLETSIKMLKEYERQFDNGSLEYFHSSSAGQDFKELHDEITQKENMTKTEEYLADKIAALYTKSELKALDEVQKEKEKVLEQWNKLYGSTDLENKLGVLLGDGVVELLRPANDAQIIDKDDLLLSDIAEAMDMDGEDIQSYKVLEIDEHYEMEQKQSKLRSAWNYLKGLARRKND